MKEVPLKRTDIEFARRHGLTNREMRDYIEEMVKEEEMMHSFYRMKEKELRYNMNSPQAFYHAW